MALTPYQADNLAVEQDTPATIKPQKTYEFDFESGEFTDRIIDDEVSLRQAIVKILKTPRFRYLIYNADYGSEIMSLLGTSVTREYLNAEVPRMVREALVIDDRIEDVVNIVTEQVKDTLTITFQVITSEGFIFDQEVAI